jgi:hypothetical protein
MACAFDGLGYVIDIALTMDTVEERGFISSQHLSRVAGRCINIPIAMDLLLIVDTPLNSLLKNTDPLQL